MGNDIQRLRHALQAGLVIVALTPFVLLHALAGGVLGAEPSREQIEFFEKKIRPVFVEQCYKCHLVQSAKLRGGLTPKMPVSF
jgi:hypothetical protein